MIEILTGLGILFSCVSTTVMVLMFITHYNTNRKDYPCKHRWILPRMTIDNITHKPFEVRCEVCGKTEQRKL